MSGDASFPRLDGSALWAGLRHEQRDAIGAAALELLAAQNAVEADAGGPLQQIADVLGTTMAALMPAATGEERVPWCDCKVAFGIDDPETFERWMDRTDDGEGLLPAGWTLCETDGTGARYVAIFRVDGALALGDGSAVAHLLRSHGGAAP